MAILTLQEYKQLCNITDDSGDLLLEKLLSWTTAQIISWIGANPCCEDEEGNPILKMYKVKKRDYDPCKCTYCFDLPIPVKEIVGVNGKAYKHSACGTQVTIKAPACIANCFDELEVEYYWGRDNTDDLCLLIKMMVDAQWWPTKAGNQISSAKFWCETISFCCPDTNVVDSLLSGIRTKYFRSNFSCVV